MNRRDSKADSPYLNLGLIALWVLALAAAAYFRFHHLAGDAPHLDEWHPLLAIKRRDRFELIASAFGLADRSIPVALYLELLSRTVGLSDLAMRVPFALCGMLSLVVLPLALKNAATTRFTLPTYALLLAQMPFLVYYSRSIRPYGPATLFAFVAVAAWTRCALTGDRGRWAWAYVGASAMVGWLLPVLLPFVVTPPLVELVSRLRRNDRAGATRIFAIGLKLTAVLAILIGPALIRDASSLAVKAARGGFEIWGSLSALRVLSGLSSTPLALLWGAAVAASAIFALRSGSSRARAFALAALGQLVALVVVRPFGIDVGTVLARYLLPVAALGWFAVADQLQRVVGRLGHGALLPSFLTALALPLALYWAGPLRGWFEPQPDNFATFRLYQRTNGARSFENADFPTRDVYRELRGLAPGSLAILEVPYSGYLGYPYGSHQLVHRQEVYLGVVSGFCAPINTIELAPVGVRGFALSRFLSVGDLPTLREHGIRYVYFHRHTERKVGSVYLKDAFFKFDDCVSRFQKLTGIVPTMRESVAVFDLARIGRSVRSGEGEK